MTQKRKTLVCLILLLVAAGVALAAVLPTYWVESSSNAQLVCNRQECFVFVDETHFGWMGNHLLDIGHILRAWVGGASPPTHINNSARGRLNETHAPPQLATLFFRVTPEEIERLWAPGSFSGGGVNENGLYVGAGWWKWNGKEFEGVSAAERARFQAATDRPTLPQFSDYHGWSSWVLATDREHPSPQDFPVTLAGREITISAIRESSDTRRIKVSRGPDGAPETIWSLDEGPRSVDRTTYAKILGLRW